MDLSIIEDLRQRAIGFNKGTLFTNCTYGRLFVSCPLKEKHRAWGMEKDSRQQAEDRN